MHLINKISVSTWPSDPQEHVEELFPGGYVLETTVQYNYSVHKNLHHSVAQYNLALFIKSLVKIVQLLPISLCLIGRGATEVLCCFSHQLDLHIMVNMIILL